MDDREIYTNFLYNMRKIEMQDPHILLYEDLMPRLRDYMKRLINVKFIDGKYHAYYGELKLIVRSFNLYRDDAIYQIIRLVDRYSQVVSKEELLTLMGETFNMHQIKQIEFGKEFLPVSSQADREKYEEIERTHEAFMEELCELNTTIEKFDKKNTVLEFAATHFHVTLARAAAVFDAAHLLSSRLMATWLKRIYASALEIALRIRTNIKQFKEEEEKKIQDMKNDLYEKNKDYMMACRKAKRNSVDIAEIARCIELLQTKIEDRQVHPSMVHLLKEEAYWSQKLNELDHIRSTLDKLKLELESIDEHEEGIKDKKCDGGRTDTPRKCYQNAETRIAERRKQILEVEDNAARAVFTFFTVKGYNRKTYEDTIGTYSVDEYHHQKYIKDHGLKFLHIDCKGNFREFPDDKLYYYDSVGRYIIEDGEKVYQIAPCTSLYNLGDDMLLKKKTQDCGHSEKYNRKCRMQLKDMYDVNLLPDCEPMDITNTQSTDTVRYLWDVFGSVLPYALHDVGEEKPNNPIHFLAHRLLFHKYNRTLDETSNKFKEAQQYRADIYKDRLEKAKAASLAWMAKQPQRLRPELYDNTENETIMMKEQADNDMLNLFNLYN